MREKIGKKLHHIADTLEELGIDSIIGFSDFRVHIEPKVFDKKFKYYRQSERLVGGEYPWEKSVIWNNVELFAIYRLDEV